MSLNQFLLKHWSLFAFGAVLFWWLLGSPTPKDVTKKQEMTIVHIHRIEGGASYSPLKIELVHK